jgi:hypothetical protein
LNVTEDTRIVDAFTGKAPQSLPRVPTPLTQPSMNREELRVGATKSAQMSWPQLAVLAKEVKRRGGEPMPKE